MNYDRLLQLGGIDREVPPIPGYITKEELKDGIDDINTKIPEEASEENQLADKNYVNEQVSTYSATFRSTYNLVSDLQLGVSATRAQIEAALPSVISTADNNDFCNVQVPVSDDNPTKIDHTERYKYNGTAWSYEFDIADPSSIPTALSELSDDSTHRLVTDTEKAAWGGKAEVGTAQDTKTDNTVYGAKAFTVDAVNTESDFQKNFASIMSLCAMQEFGINLSITTTGWKIVVTDANYNILMGKRDDDSWYFSDDLDTILDEVISGYTPI